MISTFTCRHCRREKAANPRLKGNQKYCGVASCQRARKAEWKRQKMATDADYRLSHQLCNEQWREANTSYWRSYRKLNPDKVERNRMLQKLRRIKAKNAITTKPENPTSVAKVDALFTKELQGDTLFWLKSAVAKVDTLLVEISPLSTSYKSLQR